MAKNTIPTKFSVQEIFNRIFDAVTNLISFDLGSYISGEDPDKDVLRVQQPFSSSRVTADGLITSGSGLLHTLVFAATGTVTSGVITVYDNTAESGTVLFSGVIQTGINPIPILLDIEYANGIYVGYDGTIANVATHVSFD